MTHDRPHPALLASEARVHRWLANDLPGMADLLDKDLVYVHSTGQVHGKSQLLAFFQDVCEATSVDRSAFSFTAAGGLAVIACVQQFKGCLRHPPGAEIAARSHFSEVWREADGAWRLLHAQSTAIALGDGPSTMFKERLK